MFDRTYVAAAASTVGVRPIRVADVRRGRHGHPSSARVLRTPSETGETIWALAVDRPPPTGAAQHGGPRLDHTRRGPGSRVTAPPPRTASTALAGCDDGGRCARPRRRSRHRDGRLAGTLHRAEPRRHDPAERHQGRRTAVPAAVARARSGDGFAGIAGRRGGFAAGNITITAINGSSVSLETVDGWSRTITVTDQTTITKDGEAIALTDLQVGDKIRFRQTVDDAGNYTITAIAVVLPSVLGQATAVDSDSITLSQPDGTSVTVHVNGSTKFTVGGETGKSFRRRGRHDRRRERRAECRRVAERIEGPRRHDLGRPGSRAGRGHGPGKWANPDDAAPSGAPENSSTNAG